MSYILEALKKAQAERQLGSAPTIHATPIHAAPVDQRNTRLIPILAGGALLVLAVAAAIFAWRSASVPEPAAPVVLVAAPPVQVPAPAPLPAPLPAPVPAPAAVAPMPAPVSAVRQAPPPRVAPVVKPAAPKSAALPVTAAAPVTPVAEDTLRTLRDMPEAIQREVPAIAIGGYIYSKNPADRLLLIDKVLRREGEEVAPGLTLEKLLPKAAIMNYRGYRYRVPY